MTRWLLFLSISLLVAATGCAGAEGPLPASPSGAGPTLDPLAGTPYAPAIDPDDFVGAIDNPYMPLTPGVTRIYESRTAGGLERIEVTVPFGAFDDVVQTEDWTPLEPDLREYKFFARGVGVIREVNLQTGEAVELVSLLMP